MVTEERVVRSTGKGCTPQGTNMDQGSVNAASWLTSATIREWDWIEEGRQIWTHHRVMNGCDIRTSRKYTLPQGSVISFPRPDYPHSKLNDAIGGVTFSGRNHLGCNPPYHCSR